MGRKLLRTLGVILLVCGIIIFAVAAMAQKETRGTEIRFGIMVAGILLYQIASFAIQQYDNTKLDFWNYGKITPEGVLYIGMKICGVIIIAETLLDLVFKAVHEIKKTIRDSAPFQGTMKTANTVASESSAKTVKKEYNYSASAAQQRKIPAWKQVEMEKQDKQD